MFDSHLAVFGAIHHSHSSHSLMMSHDSKRNLHENRRIGTIAAGSYGDCLERPLRHLLLMVRFGDE